MGLAAAGQVTKAFPGCFGPTPFFGSVQHACCNVWTDSMDKLYMTFYYISRVYCSTSFISEYIRISITVYLIFACVWLLPSPRITKTRQFNCSATGWTWNNLEASMMLSVKRVKSLWENPGIGLNIHSFLGLLWRDEINSIENGPMAHV
jgi:hypothetical protein